MNASIYPRLDQLPDGAAERRQLLTLLDQTLDAVPDNSTLTELPAVASVLVGKTVGQCARKGILPISAQAGTLIACREALNGLPDVASVADFRTAAKAALRASIG